MTTNPPEDPAEPAEAAAQQPPAAGGFAPPAAAAAPVVAGHPPAHGRPGYPPYGRPAGYPPPPPAFVYQPTKIEKLFRAWRRPARPMSPSLVVGALVAGVIGAVTVGPQFREGLLGVGVLVAAAAVAYVAAASAWSAGRVVRPATEKRKAQVNRTAIVFGLLAVGLSAVAAVREAEWVVVPALLLAVALGSYAASGGRSWPEVLFGGLAVLPAAGAMLPWAGRGAYGAVTSDKSNAWPVIRTALVAGGLLAVFGALFVGADAAFGSLAAGLVPEVSAVSVIVYGFTGVATLLLASAGAYLGQAPPPLRVLSPEPGRPAGRWSWAVPIAALDLLFLVFCAIQAGVFLAADKDALLRSTGLTYAEYARQGFFQLVIVTVLVLVVVAVAKRYAPKGDQGMVRVLLGLLCTLTLVVVAVALRRLYLYEQMFGWTRLRLWVHAFELWLGFVVVLVAVAGVVKGRVPWLPRTVAVSGAVALIVLAVLNPDRFIAEHNVARYKETGKIDVPYLRGLSADAVPALDELPEPMRSCALRQIAFGLSENEPAMSANLSRAEARKVLERRPIDESADCFSPPRPS
ncbi:DUF4153 domain-containing protein [Actinomadura latina]|uniref:DUF4173 domain-containing protein n=1 Tax=Actinomadura latina TaxID=163603 RepID=A0A846YYF6_9ACTN|nr:DUF4173 domain-containing protein [Actinomadura latina]NKZ05549.1 DUF4173 domain-containing protein [Actinomadura latina]